MSPDLLKAIDPTGAALSPGQQAAMAGFATLLGGGLAGLAGANAQGGAMAAQNEVLNNTDKHPEDAAKNGGVLSTLSGAFSDLLNANNASKSWVQGQVNQFIGLLNANSGQTPPSDPNPLVQANDGNNTPSGTAGAVVTPPVAIPLPNGTIATTPPLIAPGTPILSNGDGNDSGSTSIGQGSPTAGNGADVPVGVSGSPMTVPRGTNTPTTINGVDYSGHAIDQMQGRGILPSVVENTIENGSVYPTRPGTTGYYDPVNNVRVITNSNTGLVVTVIPGAPGK